MLNPILINSSNNKFITTIYHLSDIHIRDTKTKRYEYEQVFQNLYRQIGQDNSDNSVIIICGNLQHGKEQSFRLLFNFLESLLKIADVIIIPGQHDSSNLEILVEHVKHDINNLIFLKQSGAYQYHNIVFSVSSSCNQNGIIKADKINTRKMKIALFNGTVNGSINSLSKLIEFYDCNIEEFNGYDIVLLGGIHKHQYLKKNIAYSSNLIQQNYNEPIKEHGFIRWDLKNKTSQFVPVYNNYCYATICIENNKLLNQLELCPKTRIRIKYRNTTKQQCNKILRDIASAQNIEWVRKEWQQKKMGQRSINFNDISISKHIIGYCKEKCNITDSQEIKNILEIHNKLLEGVPKNAKTFKWKIISLEFTNMFSYEGVNKIMFNQMNGMVSIIAPNHYGKSSIIDVILFCLYGKCTKGAANKDILNIRSKELQCVLVFSVGNVKYKIKRVGIAKKLPIKNLAITTIFKKYTDDGYEYLTGINNTETNERIAKLIGTYDDLISTNFVLQKKDNFTNIVARKKLDFLIRLSNVSIFSSLLKQAKKALLKKKALMKAANYVHSNNNITQKECDDKVRMLEKIRGELDKLKESIRQTDDDIYNLCLKLPSSLPQQELEKKLREEEHNYKTASQAVNKKKHCLNNLRKELVINITKPISQQFIETLKESIQKPIQELVDKAKSVQSTISVVPIFTIKPINEIKNSISIVKGKIEKTNNKILLKEKEKKRSKLRAITRPDLIVKNWNILQKHIKEREILQQKKILLETRIKELRYIDVSFKTFKQNIECDTCKNNPFTIQAQKLLEDYTKKTEELKTCNNRLTFLGNKIEQLNRYQSLHTKMDKDIEFNKSVQEKMVILDKDIELLEKDKSHYQIKLTELNNSLSAIQDPKKGEDCNSENIKDSIMECLHLHIDKLNISQNRISEQLISKITILEEEIENDIINASISKAIIEQLNASLNESFSNNYSHQSINEQICNLKKGKALSMDKLDQLNKLKAKLMAEVYQFNNILNSSDGKHSKIDIGQLMRDIFHLETYIKIVSRNGLPYSLLDDILINLKTVVNNILSSCADFRIVFEKIAKGKTYRIEVCKKIGDQYINILNCSGYEQCIVNLAIRIALLRLDYVSGPNFMVIDEGFTSLDKSNTECLESLFSIIRDTFDFSLIVTHNNELKRFCDDFVDIVRSDDDVYSRVMYA